MSLLADIGRHLMLDAALFCGLWLLLIRSKHRLHRWPLLTQYRYAHRGYHDADAGIPENSLAAFRRAAELGFGAELDVHLTADGRLAVIHDSSLRRMCGCDGVVETCTAAMLAKCRLGGTEERIPFLEEVLALFEGRQPLLIELKTRANRAALVDALCRALAHYGGDVCVESFDPLALYLLRRRRPEYMRGQLSKNFLRDKNVNPVGGLFLSNLWLNFLSRPDFIAYRYEDRRAWSLRLCKALYGTREFSWTITAPAQMRLAEADDATVIFEGFHPAEGEP